MLKGVHPLIGPELLATLARMGHGDLLLVVDRNYPAYAAAVPVHRMDGVGAVAAIEAILTLLPIDDFIDTPMLRMGPVDHPAETTPIQDEARALVERVEGRSIEVEMLERSDFLRACATGQRDRRHGRAAAVRLLRLRQGRHAQGLTRGVAPRATMSGSVDRSGVDCCPWMHCGSELGNDVHFDAAVSNTGSLMVARTRNTTTAGSSAMLQA